MTSVEHELHIAIIEALSAAPSVDALLARHGYESPQGAAVYDYVPQEEFPEDDSRFPYIVVGDTTATPEDADSLVGFEHTVTLHIWDRYHGRSRVRQILDAVHGALHDASLVVSDYHCVYCLFDGSENIADPEDLIQHSIIRFRIATQRST